MELFCEECDHPIELIDVKESGLHFCSTTCRDDWFGALDDNSN